MLVFILSGLLGVSLVSRKIFGAPRSPYTDIMTQPRSCKLEISVAGCIGKNEATYALFVLRAVIWPGFGGCRSNAQTLKKCLPPESHVAFSYDAIADRI